MLSAVWGLLFSSTSRTRHSNGEIDCRLESWQPCRPFLPLIKPIPHFILICLSIKVFLEMWKQRLPISSSPLVSIELSRPCADKRVTCLPLSSISGGNNDYFLIGAEQSSGESGCYSNFPCRVWWAEGAARCGPFFSQPMPNSSCSLLSHKNLKSPSLFSLTTFPTSFTCLPPPLQSAQRRGRTGRRKQMSLVLAV